MLGPLALALLAGCAQAAKPHVLLVLADDLGYGNVGWTRAEHGCPTPEVQTPVLDALVLEVVGGGELFTDSTLKAVTTTSDVDDDSVGVSYTWVVDGEDVDGVSGDLLPGSAFEQFEEIYVIATPNDGVDDGDSVTSGTIAVLNSVPSAPTVVIEPSS